MNLPQLQFTHGNNFLLRNVIFVVEYSAFSLSVMLMIMKKKEEKKKLVTFCGMNECIINSPVAFQFDYTSFKIITFKDVNLVAFQCSYVQTYTNCSSNVYFTTNSKQMTLMKNFIHHLQSIPNKKKIIKWRKIPNKKKIYQNY